MIGRHHGAGYPMHDSSGGWWFLSLFVVILLAVAVAVLLTIMFRLARPTATSPSGTSQQDAFQILRRRYAAGEIDDEEFHRRSAALREP